MIGKVGVVVTDVSIKLSFSKLLFYRALILYILVFGGGGLETRILWSDTHGEYGVGQH